MANFLIWTELLNCFIKLLVPRLATRKRVESCVLPTARRVSLARALHLALSSAREAGLATAGLATVGLAAASIATTGLATACPTTASLATAADLRLPFFATLSLVSMDDQAMMMHHVPARSCGRHFEDEVITCLHLRSYGGRAIEGLRHDW